MLSQDWHGRGGSGANPTGLRANRAQARRAPDAVSTRIPCGFRGNSARRRLHINGDFVNEPGGGGRFTESPDEVIASFSC